MLCGCLKGVVQEKRNNLMKIALWAELLHVLQWTTISGGKRHLVPSLNGLDKCGQFGMINFVTVLSNIQIDVCN